MNPFDHLNRIALDAAKPVFALVFSATMVDIMSPGLLTAVFTGVSWAAAAWLAVYLIGLCSWILSRPQFEEAAVAPAPQPYADNHRVADDDPLAPFHTTLTAARANGRLPAVSLNKLTEIGIRKDVAGNPARVCRDALLAEGFIDQDGRFTPLGQHTYPSPADPDMAVVAATTSGGRRYSGGGSPIATTTAVG